MQGISLTKELRAGTRPHIRVPAATFAVENRRGLFAIEAETRSLAEPRRILSLRFEISSRSRFFELFYEIAGSPGLYCAAKPGHKTLIIM